MVYNIYAVYTETAKYSTKGAGVKMIKYKVILA